MSAFWQQLVAGLFGLGTALLAAWAKPYFEQRARRARTAGAGTDDDGGKQPDTVA